MTRELAMMSDCILYSEEQELHDLRHSLSENIEFQIQSPVQLMSALLLYQLHMEQRI